MVFSSSTWLWVNYLPFKQRSVFFLLRLLLLCLRYQRICGRFLSFFFSLLIRWFNHRHHFYHSLAKNLFLVTKSSYSYWPYIDSILLSQNHSLSEIPLEVGQLVKKANWLTCTSENLHMCGHVWLCYDVFSSLFCFGLRFFFLSFDINFYCESSFIGIEIKFGEKHPDQLLYAVCGNTNIHTQLSAHAMVR